MLRSPYSEALQALSVAHESASHMSDTGNQAESDVPTRQELKRFAGRLLVCIAGGYAALTAAEHVLVTAGKPVVSTIESAVDRLNGIECKGKTDPYVVRPYDTFDGLAQRLDPSGILNTEEFSGFIQQQSGYEGDPGKLPAGMTIQLVRAGDCSQ